MSIIVFRNTDQITELLLLSHRCEILISSGQRVKTLDRQGRRQIRLTVFALV